MVWHTAGSTAAVAAGRRRADAKGAETAAVMIRARSESA